jgi:hypothetical protein
MKACCEIGTPFAPGQRRVLQVVLWVNAAMFLGEFVTGLVADSTALLRIQWTCWATLSSTASACMR